MRACKNIFLDQQTIELTVTLQEENNFFVHGDLTFDTAILNFKRQKDYRQNTNYSHAHFLEIKALSL